MREYSVIVFTDFSIVLVQYIRVSVAVVFRALDSDPSLYIKVKVVIEVKAVLK